MPIIAAGAEREPRNFHARVAQRHHVRSRATGSTQRQCAHAGSSAGDNRGFQKIASIQWAHRDLLDGEAMRALFSRDGSTALLKIAEPLGLSGYFKYSTPRKLNWHSYESKDLSSRIS